jgi:integrase
MTKRTPSYCLHKATGQAVVRIDGKDHYLGKHGTPESRAEYNRLIGEWFANAQSLPSKAESDGFTVNVLLVNYWRWAEEHYRDAEGKPSRELENVKDALRPLRKLYGETTAASFGPLALRAVQQHMVQAGLARTVVNSRINRIRRVFKWASSFELLPVAAYEALRTVPGLQRGRCAAREAEPVGAVRVEHVQAAQRHMPAPVRTMVELQLLTGMRAGEVMAMRAIDLNTAGSVWEYRPARHKNQHRGLERVILLGPQAQEVLRPFLTTNLEAYLFSPKSYVEELHARRALQRKTKRTPSESKRRRKPRPKRTPGERYTRRSYRAAVVRACHKADVPEWSPLQLRHTAATSIRAKYGIEAAKVILGHTKIETSQIYAERDLAKAQRIRPVNRVLDGRG